MSTSSVAAPRFLFAPAACAFARLACVVRVGGASSSESSIVIVSDAAALDDAAFAPGPTATAWLADALVLPLSTSRGFGRAYSSVQRRASRSCWTRLRTYSVAMDGTGGCG